MQNGKTCMRLHGLHWASFEALEASSFGGTFHMGQRTHWNASVVCPLPLGRKFESFKPRHAFRLAKRFPGHPVIAAQSADLLT
jgi:hypothetical protein